MNPKILFNARGTPISPGRIGEKISEFGETYNETVKQTIEDSETLDREGEVFVRCAARILSNFKMTRRGPFRGVRIAKNGNVIGKRILAICWEEIGRDLMGIRASIAKSRFSRERFLLQISRTERQDLISAIWLISKRLLPFTMGESSYGLVGASKILFSVLPEIVLPVDNKQWLTLFQTVDVGDVINHMVSEVQKWEKQTKIRFNELDPSGQLTTLPSIYNVMAMDARPQK